MSGKIRGKDLSYDASLPPFLQRLRAQHSGNADADRHERAIARPKRAAEHNEEDDPLVIGQDGETMSKEEIEKLKSSGQVSEDAKNETVTVTEKPEDSQERSEVGKQVSNIVPSRKRKAVKVIDEHDNNDDGAAVEKETPKAMASSKKKRKPIKLAFEDEPA